MLRVDRPKAGFSARDGCLLHGMIRWGLLETIIKAYVRWWEGSFNECEKMRKMGRKAAH